MLRSSLGFHTITLCISLPYSEADKLLIDFSTYRKNTRLIEMYRNNTRNDPIIYYHKSPIMPLKVDIYTTDGYRGIKWCFRASEKPSGSSDYIIEAKINPKFLAGIPDYLTAATYSDMKIAIYHFNLELKKISPLLRTFNDYKITRVDYCANICMDEFVPGCAPELIMELIRRSNVPYHYKERMVYDDTAHRMVSEPESFYLVNRSVVINYYSKYMQLLKRSQKNIEKGYAPIPQSTLDAARGILRFEIQYKYPKINVLSKEIESSGHHEFNKYQWLLTPTLCRNVVNGYYDKVIGKGDWYTLHETISIIKSKNFNSQKEKRLTDALRLVSKCRNVPDAMAAYQGDGLAAFKLTLKELSNLGVNPVTIPRSWNIKHIPNLILTYCDKALKEFISSQGSIAGKNIYLQNGH